MCPYTAKAPSPHHLPAPPHDTIPVPRTQGNKASRSLTVRLPVAPEASADILVLEAARKCAKTPPSMAAVAARCRGESHLTLNGELSPGAGAPYEAARPETSRTDSSGSSEVGYAGRDKDGGGGRDAQGEIQQTMACSGTRVKEGDSTLADPRHAFRQGSNMLRERERLLDERERNVREREDAVNDRFLASADTSAGFAGVGYALDDATYFQSAINPHPPGSDSGPGRKRASSATVMQRHGGGSRQQSRPDAPTLPASGTGGNRGKNGNNSRTQTDRRHFSPRHRAEDEASLIAKCRALHSARRTAVAERREPPPKTPRTPNRQRKQADSQPLADFHQSATNENDGMPPTLSAEHRRRLEFACEDDRADAQFGNKPTADLPHDADGKVTEIRAVGTVFGRAPSRPPTAGGAQRQGIRPQSRPLSAAISRRNGETRCATTGGQLLRTGGRGAGIKTVRDPEI